MAGQGTSLRESLTTERNRRINDRFAARARLRKILHESLEPRLRSALDALETEPPHPEVARERLDRALCIMGDECAKLDAEDRVDKVGPNQQVNRDPGSRG